MPRTPQHTARPRMRVNRYPGTCKDCGTHVPRLAGIALKAPGEPWRVACADHAGETHGLLNPWRDDHHGKETGYVGGEYTHRHARALVDREYRDTDMYSAPCSCGGRRWVRATVGTVVCPDCGGVGYEH
ncbi:hypothetical protein [Actinomadura sp. K4S16]|uniref:hypothetical protein n=1 Tax=Actinomadura sp. K4S16 TaxID=1316147 RepID=UPI0011ECD22D|nr:hypothetical protein [Actinomadura sp. K4S16]